MKKKGKGKNKQKGKMSALVKVMLAINIIVVAMYILSAFCGHINPNTMGYVSAFSMAYPVMFVLLLFTFLFWIFTHRMFLLISLVALVATVSQIMTFFPLHFNNYDEVKTSDRFTLMSYNAKHMSITDDENRIVGVIEDILEYNPDFVCLQEGQTYVKMNQRGINEDLLARMKARYPYDYASNFMNICGFLSKKPVSLVLSEGDDGYFNLEVFKTEALKGTAYILNTHLESIGLTDSDKELYLKLTDKKVENSSLRGVRSRLLSKLIVAAKKRSHQAERIRAVADSLSIADPKAKIFICGDFNDPPYTYSYLTINGDMSDAMKDAGLGYSNTYHDSRFYFRIDHIFYDPGKCRPVCTFVAKTESSDHYPVISVFENKLTNK